MSAPLSMRYWTAAILLSLIQANCNGTNPFTTESIGTPWSNANLTRPKKWIKRFSDKAHNDKFESKGATHYLPTFPVVAAQWRPSSISFSFSFFMSFEEGSIFEWECQNGEKVGRYENKFMREKKRKNASNWNTIHFKAKWRNIILSSYRKEQQ